MIIKKYFQINAQSICIFLITTLVLSCGKTLSDTVTVKTSDANSTGQIGENSVVISGVADTFCHNEKSPQKFCTYEAAGHQSVDITFSPSADSLTSFFVSLPQGVSNEWKLDASRCPSNLSEACVVTLTYSPALNASLLGQQSLNLSYTYKNNNEKIISDSKLTLPYKAQKLVAYKLVPGAFNLNNLTQFNRLGDDLFVIADSSFKYISQGSKKEDALDVLSYNLAQLPLLGKIILHYNSSQSYSIYDASAGKVTLSNLFSGENIQDVVVSEEGIYGCKKDGPITLMHPDGTMDNLKITEHSLVSFCTVDHMEGEDILRVFSYDEFNKNYLTSIHVNSGEKATSFSVLDGNRPDSMVISKNKIFIPDMKNVYAYKEDFIDNTINVISDFSYSAPINTQIISKSMKYDEKNDLLYLLTSDSTLRALDGKTGVEKWHYIFNKVNKKFSSPILTKNNNVLIIAEDGKAYGFSPETHADNTTLFDPLQVVSGFNLSAISEDQDKYLLNLPSLKDSRLTLYSVHLDW